MGYVAGVVGNFGDHQMSLVVVLIGRHLRGSFAPTSSAN
jgi:hypothetical protein